MLENQNFAAAGMLIRKPIAEVFEAFINPEITTKFWFTKSSGKLEKGKEVSWTWEMYNFEAKVKVLNIIENERIEVEWGNEDDKTRIIWNFKSLGENETFVNCVNDQLKGNTDEIKSKIRDLTNGHALVLAGCKIWLEHGIEPNFVGDRHPKKLN